MRNSFERSVTLLLCCLLHLSESKDSVNGKTKTSRARNENAKLFGRHPSGGLISFNSDHELLRIDWDVSIPFVSIPLEYKIGENGEVPALFNVNTKSLGIVGLIVSLLGVVSPLFSKTHQQYNYRSVDDGGVQWLQMGNTINEMMFNNDYVVPCMQRIVCSMVSVAAHSENPTSTDKIIDGLSSHSWFKGVTNGTIIEDAVTTGRKGGHDCARIYKDCLITPKLLKSMMSEFGIM
ncbi:hypothetical protein WN51_03594 [Melipona quadrifasciata]|uniref:Uncharacterized protein n=1 Tax=Melipona quadrifasciata TaxID=166423 RepID=A0A0M8ZWI6_9HYME|nr:hypothetical protein WN51_03594 [Melipona quadrifasciata]